MPHDVRPRLAPRRRVGDHLLVAHPPALRLRSPRHPAVRLEGPDQEERNMRCAGLRPLRVSAGAGKGSLPGTSRRVRTLARCPRGRDQRGVRMISFGDRGFCTARCGTLDCVQNFTPEREAEARAWWGNRPGHPPVDFLDLAARCTRWRPAPRPLRMFPISGGEVTNLAPAPGRPAVAPARSVLTEGACP